MEFLRVQASDHENLRLSESSTTADPLPYPLNNCAVFGPDPQIRRRGNPTGRNGQRTAIMRTGSGSGN
jgi:hypothetical protein